MKDQAGCARANLVGSRANACAGSQSGLRVLPEDTGSVDGEDLASAVYIFSPDLELLRWLFENLPCYVCRHQAMCSLNAQRWEVSEVKRYRTLVSRCDEYL